MINRQRQNGAVLIVALIIMLTMTALGVSRIAMVHSEFKVVSNQQDQYVSFQLTESVLVEAEQRLQDECLSDPCIGYSINQFEAVFGADLGSGAYRDVDSAYVDLEDEKFRGENGMNASNAFLANTQVINDKSRVRTIGFYTFSIDTSVLDENNDGFPDPNQRDLRRTITVTALGSGLTATTRTVLQTTVK